MDKKIHAALGIILLIGGSSLVILRLAQPSSGLSDKEAADNTKSISTRSPQARNGEENSETQRRLMAVDYVAKLSKVTESEPFNFDEFIDIIESLKDGGLLLEEEVTRAINTASYRMDGTQLASLLTVWPDEGRNSPYANLSGNVARIIGEKNNATDYFAFMENLPEKLSSRERIIFTVSQKMDLFEAAEIGNHFDKFDIGDYPVIGKSLQRKIRSIPFDGSSEDKNVLTSVIAAYSSLTDNPDILGPVYASSLEIIGPEDPLGSLKWVRENSTREMVEYLDRPLLKILFKSHFEEATDYVNEVLMSGEKGRADRVLEFYVAEYSRMKPEDALNWVLTLPSASEVTTQATSNAFVGLWRINPARAREIVESMQDSDTKGDLVKLQKIFERDKK